MCALLLYLFTWEYRIVGVGYSGLLKRYAATRFVHLAECCGPSIGSLRVRSILKETKRLNHVAKKTPVSSELLEWVRINFIDDRPLYDNQLRPALMAGFFFFFLRISDIGNVRGNDAVSQTSDGGGIFGDQD